MDIFQTRFQQLISEIDSSGFVDITTPHTIKVQVVASLPDNRVYWESPWDELYSFRFEVPAFVVSKALRLHWVLVVYFVDPSGAIILAKRIGLFYTGEARGEFKVPLYGKRLRKSFLINFEDRQKYAFTGNNRLSKYAIHGTRLLVNKSRRDYDPTFFRKKKGRQPSVLEEDGTIDELLNVSFIQQIGDEVVADTVTPTQFFRKLRTSVRQNTPNFASLQKWELPVNPYSMQESVVSKRWGYQRILGLDDSSRYSWMAPSTYFEPFSNPTIIFSSDADLKAYQRLLSNLNKNLGRESSETPTNLVQYRQVVRMVAENASKLLRSYKALKRLDFVKASRVLFGHRKSRFREKGYLSAAKSISQNWLELQYGWKPLLLDIKNTVDSLARDYHPQVRSVTGSGTIATTVRSDILGPFNISLHSVSPFPVGERVVVRREKTKYSLRYRVSDADRAVLAQTGFLSPVSLAWEILPFSFVVDWFYPIGPYLESLAAFEGMDFVDGSKTQFTRELTGAILNYSGTKGGPTFFWDISVRGGFQAQTVKMNRSVLSTFPEHPRLRFKNPISVGHAQNALALLVANFVK